MDNNVRYNVTCNHCGRVWQPGVKSPLWWKAKKRADKGYLDALGVSHQECGCKPDIVDPDVPYRVVGYNDMCEDFDVPFTSLPKAAKLYLRLAGDLSNTVFFVDTRAEAAGRRSRVQVRLEELKWA